MATYKCLRQQEQKLGNFTLVPIRYEDRFHIMKWRNEQIYHLRQNCPLTEEDQQHYFDVVVARLFDAPQPDQILFSYMENGTCIGYGGLVHINWLDRNAEISFIMDTKLEAEHFAEHWSNYLTMLKVVAFNDLKLHKIYTYAFDLRPHLYTVLEKNGYIREATLKDHCLFNGEYKNVVIHSLWNEHYSIINYVDCTLEQQYDILKLRNHEDVRIWMVNPEIISEENHFKFIESLRNNADRLYFAIYKNGLLIGTYNLTNEGDGVWDRGIIANNEMHGKGETEKWERQVLNGISSYGIKTITAKVRLDNLRSIRYHKKLGYKEQSRDNEYIYYLLNVQ